MQAIVKTLMKLGVSPEQRDASGRTALDAARRRANGFQQDPLLMFMTRAARTQALQQHRMNSRRRRSRS
jgi:hypothetical protein